MTAGSSNGLPLTFGAAGSAFVVILLKVALDVLMGDAADGFSLWVFIIYKLRKDTICNYLCAASVCICVICVGCCLEVRVQMDFGGNVRPQIWMKGFVSKNGRVTKLAECSLAKNRWIKSEHELGSL